MNRGLKKIIILIVTIFFVTIGSFGVFYKAAIEEDPIKLIEKELGKKLDNLDIFMALSNSEKIEDFEYLCYAIENNFIYFNKVIQEKNIDWYELKKSYSKKILDCKSNSDFKQLINDFFKYLDGGCGLTEFFYTKFLFETYGKEDTYFAWHKIIHNKTLIEKNLTWVKYRYLSSYKTYLKNIYSELRYIKYKKKDSNFYTDYNKDSSIAYIKFLSFSNFLLERDKKKLYEFYKSIEDADKLIIDLSSTTIGTSEYWKNLIVRPLINSDLQYSYFCGVSNGIQSKDAYKEIIKDEKLEKLDFPPINIELSEYLKDDSTFYRYTKKIKKDGSINFKGKIYIVIRDNYGSATDEFAYFCKQTGFASLVGEETSGGSMGLYPILLYLPNSGLVFYITSSEGFHLDGSSSAYKGVKPDYYYKNIIASTIEYIKNIKD